MSGVRTSVRSPCCVLEQDTFTSQKVLVIPRKRLLRHDMTEKLFTGTLSKTKRNESTYTEYINTYVYVCTHRDLSARTYKFVI